MASLPSYVAAAKPLPAANRSAWYATTAQTYAGIMLWFAFWQNMVAANGEPGGTLAAGLWPALIGIVAAALICHFLFYLVPGLLGMQTGLPLYVVGTSTYGVMGGMIMPGLLMGLLQFGWLAFNAFMVSDMLCVAFGVNINPLDTTKAQVPGFIHGAIAAVWAVLGAFVGLKGIQYVARIATFLPLIPLVVLVLLLVKTMGGLGSFAPEKLTAAAPPAAAAAAADVTAEAKDDAKGTAKGAAAEKPAAPKKPLDSTGVILVLVAGIVGFFATAGAAGTDIASSNRDAKDVQLGGLTGIALATIFSAGLATLIVAGAYGADLVPKDMQGNMNPVKLMPSILDSPQLNKVLVILLAISSFPPACFSALIAANSFRTTLPNVNPFVSVGVGTIVAVVLAVTGWAGNAVTVFLVIGASFGPVCGAMVADYLLSGQKWAGPRAGFNPAGWISWFVGFAVGGFNLVADLVPALKDYPRVPVAPVAAFVVGFVLYAVLAKAGLESTTLEKPAAMK